MLIIFMTNITPLNVNDFTILRFEDLQYKNYTETKLNTYNS